MSAALVMRLFLPLSSSGGLLDLATRLDLAVCRVLALVVVALTFFLFLAAPVLVLAGSRHRQLLAVLLISCLAGLPLSAVAMWVDGNWLAPMNVWLVYLLWGAGYALVLISLSSLWLSGQTAAITPPAGSGASLLPLFRHVVPGVTSPDHRL